jgi:type I restriction enzyme M protein
MRILVPWRAFGDLAVATDLVAEHETRLVAEETAERDRRLRDIKDAYAPLLDARIQVEQELVALEALPYATWKSAPDESHPVFGTLLSLAGDARALRSATSEAKKAYTAALRDLRRKVKELAKLQAERDQQETEVGGEFDREIEHIREAAGDLKLICSDADEAARYFTVVERPEILGNEFNLNLPRYVNTFDPEPQLSLVDAAEELRIASEQADKARDEVTSLLSMLTGES